MKPNTTLCQNLHKAAATLAALAMLAATTPVHAANKLSGGVLRNNTNMTITYLARANSGAWKTQTLAPGQSRSYAYTGTPPVIDIAYDNTLGDGRVTYSTMKLKMWNCSSAQSGWLQTFIVTNSGRNLFISG